MREQVMMSDDERDPKWRFRVVLTDLGLVEIVEEELTSTAPTAQVTEVTRRFIMTRESAEWMRGALAKVLAQ